MVDDDFILDLELEEEIEAARNAGAAATRSGNRAQDAWYDATHNAIIFKKTDGMLIGIPVKLLQGLGNATDTELSEVEVTPSGYGLHWESLDVDLAVPQLIRQVFGTKAWMSELSRHGGQSRALTTAKNASTRLARRRHRRKPVNTKRQYLIMKAITSDQVKSTR